jgi:hypothetical protein
MIRPLLVRLEAGKAKVPKPGAGADGGAFS